MEHYEIKEVTEKKRVLTSVTCDSCNEKINIETEYFKLKVVESIGRWYWKTDDVEEKQYCSTICLQTEIVDRGIFFNAIAENNFESFEIAKVNKEE